MLLSTNVLYYNCVDKSIKQIHIFSFVDILSLFFFFWILCKRCTCVVECMSLQKIILFFHVIKLVGKSRRIIKSRIIRKDWCLCLGDSLSSKQDFGILKLQNVCVKKRSAKCVCELSTLWYEFYFCNLKEWA
jgi:hypothetical protein